MPKLLDVYDEPEGGWIALRASTGPADENLPTLNDCRRTESARVLTGTRRRLGL